MKSHEQVKQEYKGDSPVSKHISSIITDSFLLNGKTAKHLYEAYAKDQPIIDYHCHLDPKRIAENTPFASVTDLLLGGDHYKWRAMRSFGVNEELITGNGDPKEAFRQYAKTLSYSIGNPLYHWTALELKRYFGVDFALTEETADEIFDVTLPLFSGYDYSPRGFIDRSNVEVICTTDDPADSLEYHDSIAKSGFKTLVFPTFRPDKCVGIQKPGFRKYIEKIGVGSYDDLKRWLISSLDRFAFHGCKLADHGLDFIPYCMNGSPSVAFEKAMSGLPLTDGEVNAYMYDLLVFFASEYAKRGWCMQIHIGAMRNNNTELYNRLGPDIGCDSIGDTRLAYPLSRFLDDLNSNGSLPKTILYSLNPNDLYILGSLIGNFQKGPVKSLIQLGAAWWFNDQKDGMEAQLKALANLGILGTFVGMLTDSRSFVSYARHEYFRRILCNMIGDLVDGCEYPNDETMLKKIIQGICYQNADSYFCFRE